MNDFCKKSLLNLEEHLNFLEIEKNNWLHISQEALEVILNVLDDIKKKTVHHKFENQYDEILFFKYTKPKFVSKLIYYNQIYKIETRKPYGGERVLRKYLLKELNKLKRFFDDQLEFYKYYRTGSTYLDHKYFVRNKHDIKLNLSTRYFETDHRFSTSHDYIVAKILANDLIEVFLEDQLHGLERDEIKTVKIPKSKMNWTGSKTALIELVYALYASGYINNNNADIKLIALTFEKMFNIDLGDYYRNFLAIRIRKKGRTQFLQELQEDLIRYMDSQDE
ncbi:MAG: RteC domain-containing protein [Zunongwangia sp.]|uniref:RteC domain-containing protein n=1 Tax=Zunongwangia sp. TaxID=1965325 RepID=UPI0032425CAE